MAICKAKVTFEWGTDIIGDEADSKDFYVRVYPIFRREVSFDWEQFKREMIMGIDSALNKKTKGKKFG